MNTFLKIFFKVRIIFGCVFYKAFLSKTPFAKASISLNVRHTCICIEVGIFRNNYANSNAYQLD